MTHLTILCNGKALTENILLLVWALPATTVDRPRSEDEPQLSASCLAVGKLSNLSKPQVPHLKDEGKIKIHIKI